MQDLTSISQLPPTHYEEREVSNADFRAKMEVLRDVIAPLEQVNIPLTHFFAQGVYARQGLIRKGTVVVGHFKKSSHLNIISYGDISIFTEEGLKRLTGPSTMVASPGTRRIGYAHEDTLWTTILGTDETDVAKIEEQFLAKSYEDYLDYCKTLLLKGDEHVC